MATEQNRAGRNPWLAVALLAVVAVVCTSLGFWQLDRAGQSRRLLEQYQAAREQPPLSGEIDRVAEAPSALRHRSVEVSGRFDPERQFLIDNIVRDGIPGYLVLTPLELDGRPEYLMVNRGWVRAHPDRRVLPDIAVSAEPRRVVGRLDELPAPGLELGGGAQADAADEPVLVLSYPTMDELQSLVGRPLLEYQLLLDADQPDGFEREWSGPAADPVRNLGYAGQWWLFATVAAGAAAVVAYRAVRRRHR